MFLLQRNSQSRLPRATWGWKSRLKFGKKKGGILNLIPAWRHRQQENLKPPNSAFSPLFHLPETLRVLGFFSGPGGDQQKKGRSQHQHNPPKNISVPQHPLLSQTPKKSPNRLPSSKKGDNFKKLYECRSRHGEEGEGGNFSF